MSNMEIIEGHPVVPDRDRKMLTPGAHARIYRDGGVLEGMVAVPLKGPLELRHLAPGSYVLKDETGGYEEFAVDPLVETTVVHTAASRRSGKVEGGTGEPGSSFVVPAPKPPEALKPIYPDGEEPEGSKDEQPHFEEAPQVDAPVFGEPGSALIQEIEDPDEVVDGNLARLRPDYEAPNAQSDPVSDEIPEEQKPDKPKAEETPDVEGTVEKPVVLDARKRPVDPSVPDPRAGEIAAQVLPSERVTEDPGPVREKRPKKPRVAKPARDE